MAKQMIEILPASNKRFKVRYYGANGQILTTSEVLNTRANAHKNIKAMEILMSGSPQVVDKTKSHKSFPE